VEEALLIRSRLEHIGFRYYRMAVWSDLFGRALLARRWSRLRLDPHRDPGAALDILAALARRRGYPGDRVA